MIRDFSQPILGLNGKPLTQVEIHLNEKGEQERSPKEFTYAAAAVEALTSLYQDEQPTGIEKVRRFKLAERIYLVPNEVMLEDDDISLLKTLVSKLYDPVVTGRMYNLLESK